MIPFAVVGAVHGAEIQSGASTIIQWIWICVWQWK